MLFTAYGSDTFDNLWVTDGTSHGTHELTNIMGASTQPGGMLASGLVAYHGEALFSALDSTGQRGLWSTDGTAGGTHEITGISGASASGINPTDLTVVNGSVFFNGLDDSGHSGLWVTDGNSAGTHEITNIQALTAVGYTRNSSHRSLPRSRAILTVANMTFSGKTTTARSAFGTTARLRGRS